MRDVEARRQRDEPRPFAPRWSLPAGLRAARLTRLATSLLIASLTAPQCAHASAEAHELVPTRVTRTVRRLTNRIVVIETRDDVFETTADHPFAQDSAGGGRWTPAGQLRVGDRLLRGAAPGSPSQILRIELRTTLSARPVYNLTVRPAHIYCVGHDAVLVHNTPACSRLDALAEIAVQTEVSDSAPWVNDQIRTPQGRANCVYCSLAALSGVQVQDYIAHHGIIQQLDGVPGSLLPHLILGGLSDTRTTRPFHWHMPDVRWPNRASSDRLSSAAMRTMRRTRETTFLVDISYSIPGEHGQFEGRHSVVAVRRQTSNGSPYIEFIDFQQVPPRLSRALPLDTEGVDVYPVDTNWQESPLFLQALVNGEETDQIF